MLPHRLDVVLGQGVLQGLAPADAGAQPGLEDLAGRLAGTEPGDADLAGDLAEGGVDRLVELGLVDLDRELDLVALEGKRMREMGGEGAPTPRARHGIGAAGGKGGPPLWRRRVGVRRGVVLLVKGRILNTMHLVSLVPPRPDGGKYIIEARAVGNVSFYEEYRERRRPPVRYLDLAAPLLGDQRSTAASAARTPSSCV